MIRHFIRCYLWSGRERVGETRTRRFFVLFSSNYFSCCGLMRARVLFLTCVVAAIARCSLPPPFARLSPLSHLRYSQKEQTRAERQTRPLVLCTNSPIAFQQLILRRLPLTPPFLPFSLLRYSRSLRKRQTKTTTMMTMAEMMRCCRCCVCSRFFLLFFRITYLSMSYLTRT